MDSNGSFKEWDTGYAPTVVLIEKGEVKEKFAGNDYSKIDAFIVA